MLDPSSSTRALPSDLPALVEVAWTDLGRPGSGWTGSERVAIAEVVRDARSSEPMTGSSLLPDSAVEAARLVAMYAADADQRWVRGIVSRLGETRYVELVGVAAVVVGMDTLTTLLGMGQLELPDHLDGSPTGTGEVPGLKMRRSWVRTTGPPLPRIALSSVPRSQASANRLLDRLYMTADQMRGSGDIRGLSRSQLELVAVVVAHGNRCFYCTLGHLIDLVEATDQAQLDFDPLGIVDDGVETGVPAGAELVALGRSAVSIDAEPETVNAVEELLGTEAAITAVEVASSFMMTTRIVEATGQPVLRRQRERMAPILEAIGAAEFPHAGLAIDRDKPGLAHRLLKKVSTLRE